MSAGTPIIHIPVLDAYYKRNCSEVDVLFQYTHQQEPKKRLHELVQALETNPLFNKRPETPRLLKLARPALEIASEAAVEKAARPKLQIPLTPRASSLQLDTSPRRQVNLNHYLSDLLNGLQNPLEEASFDSLVPAYKACEEPLVLTLATVTPIMLQAMQAIQRRLGPIRGVIIEGSDISDTSAQGLLTVCNQLNVLSLKRSSKLTKGFFKEAKWPQTLTRLNLHSTRLTIEGLREINKACPQLQSLSIDGCYKISMADLVLADYPATLQEFSYSPIWWDELESGKCVELIQTLLKCHKNNPVALTIIAESILEHSSHEKAGALMMLDSAISMSPHFYRATASRAELRRVGAIDVPKNYDAAKREVEQALSKAPQNGRLLACKARVLIHGPRESSEANQEAVTLAAAAYRQTPDDDFVLVTMASCCLFIEKNQAKASLLVDRALKMNPGNVYAHIVKGVMHLDDQEYDDAKDCFDKVLSVNPFDVWNLQNVADYYLLSKRAKDTLMAERVLRQIQLIGADDALALVELAKLYLYETDGIEHSPAKARDILEAAKAKFGNDADLLSHLGEYYRLHAREKALETLEEAYRLLPKDTKTLTSLGALLTQEFLGPKRDLARARALFEKAFEIDDTDEFTLHFLGKLLVTKAGATNEELQRGYDLLYKAHESSPDMADTCLAIAEFFTADNSAEDRDLKLAREWIDAAVKCTATKMAPVYNQAARFYMTALPGYPNDPVKARDLLVKAIDLEPENVTTNLLRIRLLMETKEPPASADNSLKIVLNATLTSREARELHQLLTKFPQLKVEKRSERLAQLLQLSTEEIS